MAEFDFSHLNPEQLAEQATLALQNNRQREFTALMAEIAKRTGMAPVVRRSDQPKT